MRSFRDDSAKIVGTIARRAPIVFAAPDASGAFIRRLMVGRPRSMQRTSGVCRSGCGLEQERLPRIHGIPRPLVAAADLLGEFQPLGLGIMSYRHCDPDCPHQPLPFYRPGLL